ncbi:uncharacterized protein LOC124444312 [Xenia sp. Carnegie-2017]|uniref:uncharacterized protein LOC124444312 n=1 Tax=Xenia sp. Carnegie-2017 TaxID=2897299 RepID=UPI001F04F841|nr:uncharacterized protein LOC124444312 [Xenia sp. Carnegie-2017]
MDKKEAKRVYSINNTKKKFKGRNPNVKETDKKQRYQTLYCMSEEEFFRTAKEMLKAKFVPDRQSYGFDKTKAMDATRTPKKNAHTAKISSSSNLSVDGILHLFALSGYDHVHSLEEGISMTSATNENSNNLEDSGKVLTTKFEQKQQQQIQWQG